MFSLSKSSFGGITNLVSSFSLLEPKFLDFESEPTHNWRFKNIKIIIFLERNFRELKNYKRKLQRDFAVDPLSIWEKDRRPISRESKGKLRPTGEFRK